MKRSPLKRRRKPRVSVDAGRVIALYRSGLKQDEIAAEFGCDPSHISRVLNRYGVVTRTTADYFPLDTDEVRRLYVDEDLSAAVVAVRLGTTKERVLRELHRAGVAVRRPGRHDGRSKRRVAAFKTECDRMRPLVEERSGGACEARIDHRCRGRGTHIHHRKMRSQGGDNRLENLMLVCIVCHGIIHRVGAPAYLKGWLVRSYDDPANVPLERAA